MMNNNWLTEIAENDDLWVTDISKWPSIVAYEYRNLRNICRVNNPYGVLICLKDNFETIIKLETLLAFAWAEQNMDEEFRNNTISQITTPNLSLGAWVDLARILVKNLKKKETSLPDGLPLEQLYKKFDRLDVVGWRNSKLGHGAMELEDDEDFRKDIIEKISDLNELLVLLWSALSGQKLYLNGVCLEGPDLARGLETSGKITCELPEDGIVFSVDPYIIIKKHEKRGKGVYFFDNQKTRTLSVFQTYSDGSQTREHVAHFENLRKSLEKQGIDSSARPDDINLAEAENRELDILQMSHGFVRPEHLTNWLRDCTKKHESGVFLLQMDRGMGKSVFTEKLDRMYEKPLVIDDDIDVRTYHFSRTQSAGSDDARSRIEWQWANEYRGGASWQKVPRISEIEREKNLSPAEAFCEFLKEVRQYSKRVRHYEKIMMVLDGLDEIVEDGLWKLLPGPDMLPEGVYIFITCRNPEETGIESSVGTRLNELVTSEKLIVTKESRDNEYFLRSYIKSTGLKGLSEEEIEFLIRKSDGRVLYLGMLCRLAEHGIAISELPNVEAVVEKYLVTLDECYGEKAGIRIREVLAVIATLGIKEPLLLKHIGGLTAEGELTLGLIGMIRDLAPILKVVRGFEGNMYTIANPDLASELVRQLPETEDTVSDLVKLGLDQIRGGYPPELPETVPVIAHIAELAQLLPNGMAELGENFSEIMDEFISKLSENKKYSDERTREIDYREQHVLYRKKILGEEHPDTLTCMNHLSSSYCDMGWYEKAAELSEHVLEARKKVLGEEHLSTLTSMSTLASCYKGMGQYKKAEKLNEHVLEARKKVLGEEHPDTLLSMNKLANCYSDMGQKKKAAELYEHVVKASKKVLGEEHPSTLLYMTNIAVCYQNLGQYKKAEKLNEYVLEGLKKMLGEEHPDTLLSMNNLASCYSDMGQYEKATELIEDVLEARKKVLGEEHPDTLLSMNNLAGCYSDMGQYKKAAELYELTLEARKKVLGEEHPETLTSMNNLAYCYRDMGQYEKGIELAEQALKLSKKVLGEEHLITIRVMQLLGLCYFQIEQYEQAEKLAEQTLEAGKHVWGKVHRDIWVSLFLQASCYLATGRFGKAIGKYIKAAILQLRLLILRKK